MDGGQHGTDAARQDHHGLRHRMYRPADVRGQAADAGRHHEQRGQLPGRHGGVAGQGGNLAAPGLVRVYDRPHRPEAGDGRLLRLPLGHPDGHGRGGRLAQVILGLGHDQLGLVRRDPQAGAQLIQVVPDRVVRRHHATCRVPTWLRRRRRRIRAARAA
jgi:hypothetical protein